MAYDKTNLSAMPQSTTSGSWQVWVYRSADAITTVRAANYIDNGVEAGMVVDDLVVVVDTNAHTINLCQVLTISAAGLVDLSDGTAIVKTNS